MTTQHIGSELMWIQGVLGSSTSGSTVDLSPKRTTSCFGSRLNGQARPSTSSKFHFLFREQYTRTSSYSGQPFIFNMIHTFGGQVVKMNEKMFYMYRSAGYVWKKRKRKPTSGAGVFINLCIKSHLLKMFPGKKNGQLHHGGDWLCNGR